MDSWETHFRFLYDRLKLLHNMDTQKVLEHDLNSHLRGVLDEMELVMNNPKEREESASLLNSIKKAEEN